jgi:hypothetical protein
MAARLKAKFDRRAVRGLIKKFKKIPDQSRKEVFRALSFAAERVRTDAILSIRKQSPSKQEMTRYRPQRTVTPALSGNAPNWDTGTLAANIKTVRRTKDVAYDVESRASYSHALEFGFRDVNGAMHGPWPFLFPAAERNKKRNAREIAKAVKDAIQREARRR